MHILETELSRDRAKQTRLDLENIRMAGRLRNSRRRRRAERTI
jgi:hypothetical protein